MATVRPVGSWIAPHVHRVIWEGITTSDDVVEPASDVSFPHKTVTVTGTFNSVTLTIEGNTTTDRTATTGWVTLNDINGSALTFTADRAETIAENPTFIRARASGATGGVQDIDVVMISTHA